MPLLTKLAGFGEGCFGDLERDIYNNKPTSGSSPPAVLRKRFESQSQPPKNETMKMPKPPVESDLNVSETKMGLKDLPFEFRALEVCLESACRCLDSETTILEQEAYPALDELTSKISTLNLERVRQIKSRLVAISGRVQKVRDELEHLLDDDGDMAEMYLSDKLARQQQDGLQYPLSTNDSPTNTPRPEMHHMGVDGMEREGRPLNGYDSEKSNSHSSSDSSSRSSDSQQLDVAELEMLLEAYFVQIDGTLNKLSTLREYVDDTEDYINIMLDDKQNHLLQMGVMMTTATLVISGSVVVTGLFGMNIHIDLFENGALPQFLWTVLGSISASILVYILVIGWCKWKRLLE